ncbi:MAG: divergent PAP2 family protein [Clostridia bacterium]|nr:divergent PAP2 family protein [Clostridia bacterium]
MSIFNEIINNKCIVVPFCLWIIIQVYKFLYELVVNKKINFKRLFGAGGMPSSHSAVVCSEAVLIGRAMGFDSTMFALALTFAGVVMYDAAGVRRAAGKQARILNKLISTPGLTKEEVNEKLTEALGHTPFQVFVGALIGVLVGAII